MFLWYFKTHIFPYSALKDKLGVNFESYCFIFYAKENKVNGADTTYSLLLVHLALKVPKVCYLGVLF